jgi:hypothetical protein
MLRIRSTRNSIAALALGHAEATRHNQTNWPSLETLAAHKTQFIDMALALALIQF